MGTEVALSFTALRAQLETERSSLYKIDENIKKIVQTTGRFSNDRFNNSSSDYLKGGPRIGARHSFPDFRHNDDSFGKRKQETKTVFSRLSARGAGSDDEESPASKRSRVVSAVSRELPSRAAVLRAQGGDEQARTRNRRMFGSLLGTLHKFKQEEIVLQTKEDKKAQVERKIEEQARLQKEKEQQERKTLFAEREHKKATIKALEAKMARVHEFEKWEASQKSLANFILTRAKPHVYWIPKKMTDKAAEKLTSSRKFHEKCMAKKRAELQEELARIEQRCLRARAPRAKENLPDQHPHPHQHEQESTEEGGRKREKFTADVDEEEKEESDGEENRRDEGEHRRDNGEHNRDEQGHARDEGGHRRDEGGHRRDEGGHRRDEGRHRRDEGEHRRDEGGHRRDEGEHRRDDEMHDDKEHQAANEPKDEPVTDESKLDTVEQNTTVEEETREGTQLSVDTSELQQSVDNPPEPTEES